MPSAKSSVSVYVGLRAQDAFPINGQIEQHAGSCMSATSSKNRSDQNPSTVQLGGVYKWVCVPTRFVRDSGFREPGLETETGI